MTDPTPEQLEIQRQNANWEERCERERKDFERTQFICHGKLNITDPCYKIGTWCGLYSMPALAGIWTAKVRMSDEGRCGRLEARHASVKTTGHLPWERIGEAGVDSGQCGIFDSDAYPKGDDNGEAHDSSTFYGKCCTMTLSSPRWGIIDEGVVSSSGYGDGGYSVFGAHDADGNLVAVKVVFIGREP